MCIELGFKGMPMENRARDHALSAIFSIMHQRERYFNWFIVAAFLARLPQPRAISVLNHKDTSDSVSNYYIISYIIATHCHRKLKVTLSLSL